MALLKNFLGDDSKDRQHNDEARAALQSIRQEREKIDTLLGNVQRAAEHLRTLGEPVAQASSDVDALNQRIGQLEGRLLELAEFSSQVQNLDERATKLTQS